MKKKIQKERASAVHRYLTGEKPQSICDSLGKTKPWLYKWVGRHTPDDLAWCEDQSRRPHTSSHWTPRRTGRFEPKGKAYPGLPMLLPNQTHQFDLVGPVI